MAVRIKEFELVDIGIEHEQYFKGFGYCHSQFDNCAVGIGNDPREALDDCLENIACQGYETEQMESDILAEYPAFSDAKAISDGTVPSNFEDSHYYIGIRWS